MYDLQMMYDLQVRRVCENDVRFTNGDRRRHERLPAVVHPRPRVPRGLSQSKTGCKRAAVHILCSATLHKMCTRIVGMDLCPKASVVSKWLVHLLTRHGALWWTRALETLRVGGRAHLKRRVLADALVIVGCKVYGVGCKV